MGMDETTKLIRELHKQLRMLRNHRLIKLKDHTEHMYAIDDTLDNADEFLNNLTSGKS